MLLKLCSHSTPAKLFPKNKNKKRIEKIVIRPLFYYCHSLYKLNWPFLIRKERLIVLTTHKHLPPKHANLRSAPLSHNKLEKYGKDTRKACEAIVSPPPLFPFYISHQSFIIILYIVFYPLLHIRHLSSFFPILFNSE